MKERVKKCGSKHPDKRGVKCTIRADHASYHCERETMLTWRNHSKPMCLMKWPGEPSGDGCMRSPGHGGMHNDDGGHWSDEQAEKYAKELFRQIHEA